jgi:pyocin large subunit-like protein
LVFGVLLFACNSSPTKDPSPQPPKTPVVSFSQSSPVITHTHIGFASRQKLVDHFQKHGREFGSISMEEYLRLGQELRDRSAGENVLEAVRSDGVISRFDRTSGAFIAYNPDGVIRTFFKPNDGEAYFWRQSRRKN